jgi:hypothetical protein
MKCDLALSDVPGSVQESVESLIKAANEHPYGQG